jgi:DNA repair exonuclease SbcCD ATPase subunit
MDFPKLSLRNFLTIGQAELELDNRGLMLIQGVNEDDTSAESNGAGKSSIVDGLCWALYGITARDVSGDAVVNRTAKKDCMVSVTIVDNGTRYEVTRYRKHATGKNSVTVKQTDAAGSVTDLSKGTDKETQEVIDKIMGCSIDVFLGAIYAGQEKMPDLPGMTDKYLKLLVEQAAGTEELAEAHKEAARRELAVQREFDIAATHMKSLDQRLTDAKAEVTEAEEQVKLFEDGRKDRARTKMEPIKAEQVRLDANRAHLATLRDESVIRDEIDGFAGIATKRKDEELALRLLQQEERDLASAETRFRESVTHMKAAHEKAKQLRLTVDAQIGKPCPDCGKPYEAKDLDDLRKLRDEAITRTANDLREYVTNGKAVIEKHKLKSAEILAFEAGMTDVSAAIPAINALNAELASITGTRAAIKRSEEVIEGCKAAARVCLAEPNAWQPALESRRKKLDKAEEDVKEAGDALRDIEAKLQLHKDATAVFGPAGVRAHILDTVTPFLNERTSDYLGVLADGNIHAVWSTLAKTAKGDMKEKFNIEVTNDQGGDSFKALSGGEKRKVRLACNLALQDMKASRATKPINLWLGDEIDDALDDAGLERLMTVLDGKAKERGTVVVISHNALTDWIDTVVTVTKSGKASTLSGATHRGF